jgi:hypothetical protein
MTVPAYLPYFVIAGATATIAAILLGLRRALEDANWSAHDRAITFRSAAVIITLWFVLSLALASAGFYRGSATRLPTIQYGILVPLIIGGTLIWRSNAIKRIIDAVPQEWLIGVQLYRVLGAIFLILYASGNLPGSFAWPAGLGDALIGVLAPVVAIAYRRGPRQNAGLAFWWNTFGLADLAVAVTMGFLTSPSPFELLAFDQPNELISAFPLVLVPVFLVPLSVLLHLASLAKLRRVALEGRNGHETAPALV